MILAAALAPAVILLYYIYRKDKFQQEPVKELLSPRRNRYLILIAPIMAHGIYNSILSVIDIAPSISVLLMIAFVVMCNELRKYCSKRIQDHLRRDGVL